MTCTIATDVLVSVLEVPISVHLTVVPFKSVTLAIVSVDVRILVAFAVMTNDLVPTISGAIFWLLDERSCDLLSLFPD